MAKERLDEADVGAVFRHVRCAGVAQQVARLRRLHARVVEVAPHRVPEAVFLEEFLIVGEKERPVIGLAAKRRPHLVYVLSQPGGRPIADWNDAILAALA